MARDTKIKEIEIVRTGYDPDKIEQERLGLAVGGNESCVPKNRDYIALYADEPCVLACQKLYDLNIETYTSGGHVDGKPNAKGIAYIGINYDTLSDENKKIVDELCKSGKIDGIMSATEHSPFRNISLNVPITSDSLVGDVSDKLLDLANYFQHQDVLYGRFTYEELRNKYFSLIGDNLYLDELIKEKITSDEVDMRLREYIEGGDIPPVFTDDGELYFVSEDLLRKHNEYLNSIKSAKTR